jgi:hypothetical protein
MSDIDESALNDATWAWVEAWNRNTQEKMSAAVWNSVKPMLRAAIECYLSRAAAAPPAPSAEPSEPVAWECKAGGLKPLSQRLYDRQPNAIKAHYTHIKPALTDGTVGAMRMASEALSKLLGVNEDDVAADPDARRAIKALRAQIEQIGGGR